MKEREERRKERACHRFGSKVVRNSIYLRALLGLNEKFGKTNGNNEGGWEGKKIHYGTTQIECTT